MEPQFRHQVGDHVVRTTGERGVITGQYVATDTGEKFYTLNYGRAIPESEVIYGAPAIQKAQS